MVFVACPIVVADTTSLSEFNFASLLPVAVILLCIFYLVRRSYRYFGRRRPERLPSEISRQRRRREAGRSLSDAPNDVLRWEVQMHETARAMSAQLDSKMSALSALVQAARTEADRLESLQSRGRDLDRASAKQ